MSLIKTALLAADRSHILAAIGSFKGKPGDQWLRQGHPAPKGQFPASGWPTVAGLQSSDLINAIAVAAPNHCVDGWSYGARATSALLAGDYHSCRHLSYYAQLRAGLSMLANMGVGIFNRINFVVDAGGQISRLDTPGHPPKLLGMGTHEVVWQALKTWSADPQSARLFLQLVRIRGVPLIDSINAIWPGASGTLITGDIISKWGLDLNRGKTEHTFRNISSYNPQALNHVSSSIQECLDLVEQIWRLCEPTGSGSFNELDRFLLRNVLQGQHRKLTGNTNYSAGAITQNYQQLSPLITAIAPLAFLTGATGEPDPPLLVQARGTSNPAKPVEMLARAYLLLRAATALTHSSLMDSGLNLTAGDLRLWIDEVAEHRGFWRPGQPLADPVDLWFDIDAALQDYRAAKTPVPPSWFDWMSVDERGMPRVCEMERIGVWNLSS